MNTRAASPADETFLIIPERVKAVRARTCYRQTDRQTDRQRGRRQTDGQTDRQADRQMDRQTDRQADRQTDRQPARDGQSKHRARHMCRHTDVGSEVIPVVFRNSAFHWTRVGLARGFLATSRFHPEYGMRTYSTRSATHTLTMVSFSS